MIKKVKKNNSPKVSVLMPAYNAENYIGEAIESVLNQSFDDFEFIIINDGSKDNTIKIVREYAKRDKRIKFVDNKKNQGVAKTRNQLLDLANGEYIAFQDADDISLENRLLVQVGFLDKHSEISVVGAAMETFPEYEIVRYPESPKLLDFYVANFIPNAVVMFRKSDVEKYNIRYKENYQTCEDYDFWVQVARVLKMHNLQDVLIKYRVLEQSLSHNNPNLSVYNELIRNDVLDSLTDDEMTRLRLSPKYNVLLFGFLPLFRIKRKRIYLFCFIPFLKLRGLWWYLFGVIPFIKNKSCEK